ncbi:MAG: dihydroorotase [Melioribacteraceae bacterium]|nr:dihydroorotase [Melioribacteraceae bacterium]MCF8355805.1 dihydroorotase [Melioribacteraceae bacterium]MCF8395295.1 dihydroorotase [Melioribacteraceae bacterium]MCF8420743.1 dihydroorotase [Melioribacteraceae bacterium]
MQIILKGLKLIDPQVGLNDKNDLLIEDGVIRKIGELTKEDQSNAEIFEFDGMSCVPGLFDMHVHLREPGREDEETVLSGSNSAAAGGFTGIACMPNTNPAIDSAEVVQSIIEKSRRHLVDVYPIGAVTLGRKGESLAPIAELHEAGAVGYSDDGTAVKTASILRSALEYVKMFNSPIIEHCEDESLAGGAMNEGEVSTSLGLPPIASVAEDLIVMRDIMMAEYTGSKVHIAHISSKNAVQLVRDAKARGINVTAEVTPHHFTLTDESIKSYDTNYKMNPPLRTQEDVDAMIEGLQDGTIDCIASDHAPHSIEEKEMEFIYAPNGILGLETQFGLVLSELVHKGHLNYEQVVEKLAINPRKILNIAVPKIAVGEKANLTIFDPELIWTVDIKKFKSKSKNSPFDKRLLTGKPVSVINKSKMYFEDKFIEI